jgi:Uncharacterised nucleotidyltransferase
MKAVRQYPFYIAARVLVERLHGCEASPELRAALAFPELNWKGVVGEASGQLVLPALAAALRDLGLAEGLEANLREFLATVHAANLERNGELQDELATAVGFLNRAGIQPVLLKGAIRLADGLYPDHGWRMLRDLDLLVPKASLAEAIRALEKAGYAACRSGGDFRRRGGVCQIDLHTELFSTPRQVGLLQAVDILDRVRPVVFGDGRVGIPSVEHQLVHLIGHSQIRHLGHALGRITLRNRLEAAALVHWGQAHIDWQAVFTRFVAFGYRRPLASLLLALNDGGWCDVPVTDRIDLLTTLQQRRIALQVRSPAFAYIGSRVGWWISAFGSQLEELDGGERKGINNVKRLISGPRGARRIVQAFLDRQSHLMHVLPHLSWFVAQ